MDKNETKRVKLTQSRHFLLHFNEKMRQILLRGRKKLVKFTPKENFNLRLEEAYTILRKGIDNYEEMGPGLGYCISSEKKEET